MLMYINSVQFYYSKEQRHFNKSAPVLAAGDIDCTAQRSAITVGFVLREIHAVVDNESLA